MNDLESGASPTWQKGDYVEKECWETREMTEEEKAQHKLNTGYEPFDTDKWLDDWMNYRV